MSVSTPHQSVRAKEAEAIGTDGRDDEPVNLVVLGGTVMDFVFQVKELPQWKQAVQAYIFDMWPGGKGLNQAVAARKLGADVSIISAVGNDKFGERIIEALDKNAINHDYVEEIPGKSTSVTNVFVKSRGGEASFVGWKNGSPLEDVDKALVRKAETKIRQAEAILITLEVSLEAVREAIKIAKQGSTRIFLNPAPPLEPPFALSHVDLKDVNYLVPNQWEAQQLITGQTPEEDVEALAARLRDMGVKTVCITTSELGCVVADDRGVNKYDPFMTNPVDTTGGSDAFCAAMAISLAEGKNIDEAVERANAAGAIVVGKLGAYPSMPDRDELEAYIKKTKKKASPLWRA